MNGVTPVTLKMPRPLPRGAGSRKREQPVADKPIQISVWSDYVCPFCYLELSSLDRLKEEFGDEVTIDWRAFELRPDPVPTLDPDGEYLHRVWGQSVYPMAESRGMALRLPPVQPRSRKAFEAAEFAREAGRFADMHEALFRAFFQAGRDLADTGTLVEIGSSIGLDREELRQALDDGRFTGKVLADERQAEEIGIRGVPAIVMSKDELAFLLTGALPYEELRRAVLHEQGQEPAR